MTETEPSNPPLLSATGRPPVHRLALGLPTPSRPPPAHGVRVQPHVPTPLWREVTGEAAGDVLPSQTAGWRDAVCANGWQDASRLYTWPDGTRLLVPLVRSADESGVTYASWPEGWGVGGVIAAPGVLTADRARTVLRDLAALPAHHVYLRPATASAPMWEELMPPGTRRNPRMTQVLDLRGGFDHVWEHRFGQRTRWSVRRAERAGLSVTQDGTGRLVPEFYRLFELSAVRWAEQSDRAPEETLRRVREKNPLAKFTAVARHLGDDCRVWLASYEGQPVAAALALHHGPQVVYWQAAMDKAGAARTRAPAYLVYLLVRDACARGARTLHMGDTYPGTSVTKFKAAFGPEEHHTAGFWIPGSAGSPESPADTDATREEGRTI
ncbi:GNAT family N-acetyltransferase [Streptomyces sp. NPDC057623]|uniref:GNAT family N-acetyltransferase n=1 Tax=Streptomyces sp. NPDC057623 TaxID=3346187 RepID=UPI0036A9D24C